MFVNEEIFCLLVDKVYLKWSVSHLISSWSDCELDCCTIWTMWIACFEVPQQFVFMWLRRILWARDYSCVCSVSGLIAVSPMLTSVSDIRWRLYNKLMSTPLFVTVCHFSVLGFSGCLWCSDGSFLPASCVWSSFIQCGALHTQSQTPEGAVGLRMPACLCWNRLWQPRQWWGLGLTSHC